MNIELTGLYINAFRDIGVDQKVDIPKNTLCSVSGKNEDSGGSNGSGKTSLILADKVALFGPRFVDLTAQDCKNRHLDDVTQVVASLSVGDKKVQVSRVVGGKLMLTVDGVTTEGKVDDMQPRIDKILGVSPEHLSYLTYKAQGDYGGFVKMKDSEKKDFLGQFFNLEKIEKAGEKVSTALKLNILKLTATSTNIESLKQQTALISQDIDKILAQISSPDTDVKRVKLSADKETLKAKQYELMTIRGSIKSYQPPKPPDVMVIKQNELSSEINDMRSKIQKSEKASSDLTWIASQMVDLRSKMGHTKEGKCHACGQSVKSADVERMMELNKTKLADLAIRANTVERDLVNVDLLKNVSLPTLQVEYERVSDEISLFKANNNINELRSVESKLSEIVSALGNSIESDERYLNLMEQQLKDVKSKHDRASKTFSQFESEFRSLTTEKSILEESSRVLSRSGFLGYVFDSVLDEINYETNVNLQMIPNIKHLRVYFSPDKSIKTTGGTSKEITCAVYDGSNTISLKSLSGGEERSTCIAVDEAVDTVLSRRLGVSVGWKFLDEPFDAIDNSSKEALLEFFRLKSSKKTYLIVDHSSEFNAAVDRRIVVTKRNGVATIHE